MPDTKKTEEKFAEPTYFLVKNKNPSPANGLDQYSQMPYIISESQISQYCNDSWDVWVITEKKKIKPKFNIVYEEVSE